MKAKAQRLLLAWYEEHGRSRLPWREVRDPYRTLVAEFMLQQTQVDRVVPKFRSFIERFPTIRVLAAAGTAEVLRLWQGLGYNSRAVRLREIAQIVVERHAGEIPSELSALRALPGVGAYTAAAIRAFGYDCDDAAPDTNVRRICHRVLYGIEYPPRATLAALDADAREAVPPGRGHDWNSAMMDLGSSLCTARAPKCLLCPLKTVCAAAPLDAAELDGARRQNAGSVSAQAAIPFEQSTRFARGRIVDRLRALPEGANISLLDLHRELQPVLAGRSCDELAAIVSALARDGLVQERDGALALHE
ncbi:MAG: A/G-specific adenine glycosylase [Candidatus Eremiobacteraeota bacterium]|nr:A/G-specific adenine glycosylase [Candidatus Eremiobacteraeota bacterium]